MNKFKIIIGFLLLYGIGNEYINASKQLLSFFSPRIIIVILMMLILCAWLIGSGLSKEKLQFKSFQFAKYYGLSFIIFLLMAFMSLLTYKTEPEIVKVNGIEVDISEFMNGTKGIFPDNDQRREYCICVVTKLTQDKELADKYKNEFKSGKFSNVISNLQNDTSSYKYRFNECMNSLSNIIWTPAFEAVIRTNLTNQLIQRNISKTNDINKYCDCLIDEYKKMDIKDVTSSGFYESSKGRIVVSICNQKSKIN